MLRAWIGRSRARAAPRGWCASRADVCCGAWRCGAAAARRGLAARARRGSMPRPRRRCWRGGRPAWAPLRSGALGITRPAASCVSVQCLVHPVSGRSLLSGISLAGIAMSYLLVCSGSSLTKPITVPIHARPGKSRVLCLSRWLVRRWRFVRHARSGGGSRRAAGVRRRRIRRRSGPLRCSSPSKGAAVRSCGRVAPG